MTMGEYGDEKSPKEVMMLLSKRIRDLRKQEKISQKDLSDKSGVAYASIRKFESTGIISLESLLKMCDTLNRLKDLESILLPDDMERKKNLFK
jgi:transcriptional regulator with XRE-family HTH domain